MRKFSAFLTVLLALCFISSAAWAGPPPPPSHQRDIYWDFDTVDPYTPPELISGLSGAVYSGWADDTLKYSDWLTYGGMFWVPGAMVIDGDISSSGGAVIHLANLPDANPVKHINIQATILANFGDLEDKINGELILPGDYFDYEINYGYELTPLGVPGLLQFDMWLDILPNPEWEELQFDFFDLAAGEQIYLDELHITTDCMGAAVPIPGALWLLGSGLIGLVGLRRKFKS